MADYSDAYGEPGWLKTERKQRVIREDYDLIYSYGVRFKKDRLNNESTDIDCLVCFVCGCLIALDFRDSHRSRCA